MDLPEDVASMVEKSLNKARNGSLVQAMEGLYADLEKRGLLYTQVIHCSCIGIHPSNRDGAGVSASHVHELISDIAGLGYSECEFKGLAIEIHPDSPGDQVRSFNQQICRESQDSKFPLAPCDPSRLRFASVAGSHFNQACRALLAGVPHTDASLTVDGHLHLERLQAKDAQFHSACVNGIKWRVIPCAVAERFQEIASLAQAAGNASGQIQKAEGELQLARRVLRSMDLWRQKTKKDSVRWSDIQAEVMRSRPPGASTVPFLFTFMLKCSGG